MVDNQNTSRTVPHGETPEPAERFVVGEDFESRFKMTELLDDRGRTRYGLWEPPNIRLLGNEVRFTVPPEMEHRPDIVAYHWYGSVDYWWAIMHVNGIAFPIRDLRAGMLLIIPNVDEINAALQRARK